MAHAIETALYPLVPFANRVAHGRFGWNGRDRRIALNAPPQPHALHGLGWQSAWTVEEGGAAHARLFHRHDGDERWPFAYLATQLVVLDTDGLALTLEVENLDAEPAPMGLGLHPFFPASPGARLAAQVDGVWLTENGLPTAREPAASVADLSGGRAVVDLADTDHCFTGWIGEAIAGHARLSATGLPFLHVYAPADESFFCAEPVSHMPDALNRSEDTAVTGLRTLAPGERMRVGIRIGLAG